MEFIAHRGSPLFGLDKDRILTENGLETFKRALNLGVSHLELDFQLTSDEVPVVFHDDDLYTGTQNNITSW